MKVIDTSNYILGCLGCSFCILIGRCFGPCMCRSAKKASIDDWLECFCKREKTSSRGFYHIYLVFSTFNF